MKRRRIQKPAKGATPRKKSKNTSAPPSRDAFFQDDEVGSSSSEEDNVDPREAGKDQEEDDPETAHEKKVRLAKEYLSKLKAQASVDDGGDEETAEDKQGRRDTLVADILRQEQLEESGRVQRKLASRLIQPSEGRYLIRKHKLAVTALALTEDDKSGFSGSKDGLILQWDVETGATFKYQHPASASSKSVLALAVDSSGRYLASGGPDKTVHLWDVRSQQHIQAFPGHKSAVSALVFRQGTTQLFSGAFDRMIKIWNADDRSYMDTLFGHQSEILTLDSLRQERVLSAGRDRTLRLFKVPEESQLVFRGYTASLESCCFVTNSEFLSGADDGSVALWSSMRKKPVHVARNAHGAHGEKEAAASVCGAAESWVGAVAVCRSSDLAASGAGDGKVQLWAVEDGNKSLRPLHSLPLNGFVNALAFSRNCKLLFAGVGQEPRLGRWARNGQARNGVVLYNLELSEDCV